MAKIKFRNVAMRFGEVEEVKIGFTPENSLDFDTARQKRIAGARARPPA
ncbi:hypothetical protein SAZ10_20660 [Mesorhizobium sp. BAC0120]|nr:hypothetical protein [Mesorhizobium sp. BAC0120]MDW6024165.1 hypothetical protein [Mesorhizobium sp. BAC0120]